MKYVVDLTNDDDVRDKSPFSFGTGRYGFGVEAPTFGAAVSAVIRRARHGGFYGADWRARVAPLSDGRRSTDPHNSIHIALCDIDVLPGREWWELVAAESGEPLLLLPEGGVVLRGTEHLGAADGR